MSPWRTAAVACLLLGTAGCTSSPASPMSPTAPATPASDPALSGELRQFRSDRVRHGLQITLTSRQELTVTGVGLVADGFAALPATRVDVALPAGTPLDLPVAYGAADCARTPGQAVATLRTSQGTRTLTLSDRGLLARLHAAECTEQALAAAVTVSVDPTVRTVVRDGRPALQVTLRLVRRTPGQRVVVDSLGANVVFSVRSDRATTPLLVLGPDEEQATLPVLLAPERCDPHALAESKRTSLLAAYVGLGDTVPRLMTITPGTAVRDRLEAFAVAGCRTPP